MALSIRDYTIIQVALATHHQGDVRYGTSRLQCLCILLILASWTFFRSPGLWSKLDWDAILDKWNLFFKSPGKFRYLGIEDLPQEFFIEDLPINVQFLENKTRKITAEAYLPLIVEFVNSVQQIGTGALLIVNNYILDLILGNDYVYLFDSHSKDENGNIFSSSTAGLLKFDTLHSLENYIRSFYYNAHPLLIKTW